MKRVLFIDRDGTLVVEPPVDKQVDSLEKLEFMPKVFQSLAYVATRLDFEWVMVTNQDGMGTSSFPAENFWTVQRKIYRFTQYIYKMQTTPNKVIINKL